MATHVQLLISYLQSRSHADEKGAALVEYALLVALIAVASLVILELLGTGISDLFSSVNDKVASAGTTP